MMLPEGLDLFTEPSYLTSIEDSGLVEYSPLATLDGSTSISFNVVGLSNKFKDLSHVFLALKMRITGPSNAELKSTDIQSVFANSIYSLFKSLYVTANNIDIYKIENLYAYKEIIDLNLSYSKENCINRKSGLLFSHNNDHTSVKTVTDNSKIFDTFAHLSIPINKYILPLVDIIIRFELASKEFYFVQTSDAKNELHINEAKLFVRHITPSVPVALSIERTLSTRPASYNFKRSILLKQTIPSGSQTINLPNLFIGQKPSFLLVTFVASADLEGSILTNPFTFKPFDLRSLSFILNGSLLPQTPFTFNVGAKNNISSRLYDNLYSELEYLQTDKSLQITRKMFETNFFFIPLNLSKDYNAFSTMLEIPANCSIGLTGTFGTALAQSITVLTYLIVDSRFEINKLREVNTVY